MSQAPYREVPLQEMTDGQVQDGHRVLSARKRMGMVGVLAVVAGTAVFFNAEEQAAEAKIWDSEMAGLRNATALPDQQHRRFVVANGLGWSAAEDKCKALGVGLCPVAKVCLEKDAKREKKDKLKTGGATSRLTQELCMGKGVQSASSKTKQKDFGSVCTNKERQDLLGRWLPVVDADRHVWANLKTCEIKTSSPGEKERGVVACCGGGQHAGIFAAVHPPSVIQFAEKMVEKQNNKATKSGKSADDEWSKHEYIDKMRNADPFLAHKKQGTKMKAVHDHVAEKATEHLGEETVAAVTNQVKDLHAKVVSNLNAVIDTIKARTNSSNVGRVSGALRTSDPSVSYKMTPLSSLANSTSMWARGGVTGMKTALSAMSPAQAQAAQGRMQRAGMEDSGSAPGIYATRAAAYGSSGGAGAKSSKPATRPPMIRPGD